MVVIFKEIQVEPEHLFQRAYQRNGHSGFNIIYRPRIPPGYEEVIKINVRARKKLYW
jgi:hypothetical protein